jgi:filamentous hemagglutinin family protein
MKTLVLPGRRRVAPKHRRRIGVLAVASLFGPALAHAQITVDGTLSPAQALSGPHYAIPAALGQQKGANLFHSFGVFNLANGESATFSGPNSVANIISRVTGTQASSIDGLLRSTIPGANLFLINPRGILFGPGASLDVTGSFFASTANYLKFADGTKFEATATVPPVLSMAPPAAFGFLGPTAAPITVAGATLTPPPGGGLALVGGPLTINGGLLRTLGGDLRLIAVGSAGEIGTDAAATPSPGMSFADVTLSGAEIRSNSIDASPPGRLLIRGGQIVAEGGIIRSRNESAADAAPMTLIASGDVLLAGVDMFTETHGAGRGADLSVHGMNVLLTGGAWTGTWTTGPGAGGSYELRAEQSLQVQATFGDPHAVLALVEGDGPGGTARLIGDTVVIDGAFVESANTGFGDGGPILVQARQAAVVNGGFVGSTAYPGSVGRGGDLELQVAEGFAMGGVDVTGFLSAVQSGAYGWGNGGDIRVQAGDIDVAGAVIGSFGFGAGDTGKLELNAKTIRIRAAGPWFAAAWGETFPGSSGKGGTVALRATQSIAFDGYSPQYDGSLGNTGVTATTQGTGAGPGVVIESPRIVLDNGAEILTASYGSGDAGNVLIRTHDIEVRSGTRIASGSQPGATGRAGDIRIEGTGRLTMATAIAAHPQSPNLADIAAIFSRTESGTSSGNIFIDIPEIVGGLISHISTQTGGGAGTGGITINADRIRLTGGSAVSTDIFSPGLPPDTGPVSPGAITINARQSFEMSAPTTGNGGIFTASATAGPSGSIFLAAPNLTLDGFFVDASTSQSLGGSVVVRADTLTLRGGAAVTSSTVGPGDAGSVDVAARRIRLEGGSSIGARSLDAGKAGAIRIAAGEALEVFGGSSITTEALASDGGDIDIRAGNRVHLKNSEISTSVGSGQGAGGNIFIDPTFVILENSKIVANAFGGPGGNIQIIADYFLASPGSLIEASSQLGVPGQVQILAVNASSNGALVALPSQFLDASALLRESCGARVASGAPASSLVGVGRGGLAASPERQATSTYFGTAVGEGAQAGGSGLKVARAGRARLASTCPG